MKNIILMVVLMTILNHVAWSQGPPITGDKPVMLGENTWLIKSLTEMRFTDQGDFVKAPLMAHYLPSSNSLIGIHIPFISSNRDGKEPTKSLGDIELLGKYQFYRKDGTGKTFRMVAKTLQIIPTGEPLGVQGISLDTYQSYVGLVAGYESLKYGISNELGFNFQPDNDVDDLRHKLSFGLPLTKPAYPVKKFNLYFEYQSSWFTTLNEFMLLYAQGIQYAKGRFTIEGAVQFPLIQTSADPRITRNLSVFIGSRYIL